MFQLELKNIVKNYSKTVLNKLSLKIESAKIYTILGKNGSGKTTLSKIITGESSFDEGSVYFNFESFNKFSWNNERARESGIYFVSQIPSLKLNLKVWQYLSIAWFEKNLFNIAKKSLVISKYKWILQFYKVKINLDSFISNLNLKEIYQLLILSVLKDLKQKKLIIFDETLAYFSHFDKLEFFSLLKSLKIMGISSIFITHTKINDALKLSDETFILKDGKCLKADKENLYSLLNLEYKVKRSELQFVSREALVSFDLSFYSLINYKLKFKLREGNVTALIANESELKVFENFFLKLIPFSGFIKVKNQTFNFKNFKKLSYGLLPLGIENLFSLSNSIFTNYFARLSSVLPSPFLSKKIFSQIISSVERYYKLDDAQKILSSKAYTFSGGNLKKLALIREKLISKDFLVAFSPLSNLDLTSLNELSFSLREFAKKIPILLITADLDEALNMADEILIFKEGKISFKENVENIDDKVVRKILLI